MPFRIKYWIVLAAFLLLATGLISAQSQFKRPRVPDKQKNLPAALVSAPILGFAFDAIAPGVRPILGVPGAAMLGEPLELGFAVSYAAVSPLQNYALAVSAEDNQIVTVEFTRSGFQLSTLDGANPGVDRIFLSPNGKSAALYYQQAQLIQVWSGLPAAPAMIAEFNVAHFSGALTALALHDDAVTLLAGFSDGETGAMFVLTPGTDARLLSVLSYPSAIRFLHHGTDAVVSDRGSNTVYYVTDVRGSGQVVLLASDQDGIARPVDIELSGDDSRVLVANENTGVTSINPSIPSVQSYISSGGTSRLYRINGKAVFLLTEPSKGPLLIFDGDSEEPRIVVVPPAAASSSN